MIWWSDLLGVEMDRDRDSPLQLQFPTSRRRSSRHSCQLMGIRAQAFGCDRKDISFASVAFPYHSLLLLVCSLARFPCAAFATVY